MLTPHLAALAAAGARNREGWRVAWAFCLAVGVVLSLMTWFLSKNVNRPRVSFKKDPIGNTNRRNAAVEYGCLGRVLALSARVGDCIVGRAAVVVEFWPDAQVCLPLRRGFADLKAQHLAAEAMQRAFDEYAISAAIGVEINGITGIGAIAAGGNHSVVLTIAGAYSAWGSSGNGQLGDDSTTSAAGTPDNSTGSYDYTWLGVHQIGTEEAGAPAFLQMGARTYEPGLGRFLQTDLVAGGSCNAYDYVCQDPVNGIDLSGTARQVVDTWTAQPTETAWWLGFVGNCSGKCGRQYRIFDSPAAYWEWESANNINIFTFGSELIPVVLYTEQVIAAPQPVARGGSWSVLSAVAGWVAGCATVGATGAAAGALVPVGGETGITEGLGGAIGCAWGGWMTVPGEP